jgi:Uma2 family endonuclease
MSSQPATYVTPEEYLERERLAETKHEYVHGEIVAMAGGTPNHALIQGNVGGSLWNRLRGSSCRVYNSDLRVSVRWGVLFAYPDVTVVCGPLEFADDKKDTITNPTIVVEVLSPSTRNFDRSEKSRLYRMLPSLKEYLLIEQTPVDVEHYRRLPDGNWQISTIRDENAVIRLDSINCDLPVSEIYLGLDPIPPDASATPVLA